MRKKTNLLLVMMSFVLMACSGNPSSEIDKGITDKEISTNEVEDIEKEQVEKNDESDLIDESSKDEEKAEEAKETKTPVEPVKEIAPVLLSNDEIAQEVLNGKWGNGSERKEKLEAAGYIFKDIQVAVDKLAPKPKPVVVSPPSTPSTSTESTPAPKPVGYSTYSIYMGGGSMTYKTSNMSNMQADIDAVSGRWVSAGFYPTFNPNDNKGTFFAAHNYNGADVIMNLSYGSEIIVTDGDGTPYTYVVDEIIRYNKQTSFDDKLAGNLNKEYIIFQTCEYPASDGNIHVLATRK